MTWRMLTHILNRKVDAAKAAFAPKRERVDAKLPLGLRFGAIVDLPEDFFILYGDKALITFPEQTNFVKAWGNAVLMGTKVYRFYLEGKNKKATSVLQVIPRGEKDPPECMLFRELDLVHPTSSEEWAQWIKKGTGLIGYKDFTIGAALYTREWGVDGGDYFVPQLFTERVSADPYGDTSFVISHETMLYARALNGDDQDGIEYVMLSKEGDQEGSRISITLGISVSPIGLTIS